MDVNSPNNRVRDPCRQHFLSKIRNPTTELTSNNIIAQNSFIFKQTQQDIFNREVNALTRNKPINTTSRLRHLSPFLDEDGILQARGRLEEYQLYHFVKRQTVLYGNHPSVHPYIDKPATSIRHACTKEIVYQLNIGFSVFARRLSES